VALRDGRATCQSRVHSRARVHRFNLAWMRATRCTWSRKLVRRYLGNGVLMLLWFGISSTIILVIKVLVSGVPASNPAAPSAGNHTAPTPAPAAPALFPYPLTITTVIQSLVGITAFVASRIPFCTVASPTRQQILHFALPIGVLTSVEIGGTNYALKILHFSFAQILKAGGPFFVLIFALVLGLEKFRCELLLCLVCICGGLAVATLGEVEVKGWGMLISLGAAAAGGLKWALVQIILQQGGVKNETNHTADRAEINDGAQESMMGGDEGVQQSARGNGDRGNGDRGNGDDHSQVEREMGDSIIAGAACQTRHSRMDAGVEQPQTSGISPERPTKMSPLGTILCTAPVSFVVLLPISCVLEGAGVVGTVTCWSGGGGEGCHGVSGHADITSILTVSGLVVASSLLVFLLLIVEYILVHNTSSLAVSVARC
jgi:hypothetical protein